MKTKTLLLPLAALAVTAVSAATFNPHALMAAGLAQTKVAALEKARVLTLSGNRDRARSVVAAAGITLSDLERIRQATNEPLAPVLIATDPQERLTKT